MAIYSHCGVMPALLFFCTIGSLVVQMLSVTPSQRSNISMYHMVIILTISIRFFAQMIVGHCKVFPCLLSK